MDVSVCYGFRVSRCMHIGFPSMAGTGNMTQPNNATVGGRDSRDGPLIPMTRHCLKGERGTSGMM